MPDYTIEQVSSQPPKEWGEGTRKTFYIKVKVKGVDRALEVGKKKPDALKAGDVIHGTIIPKPDFDADGFKADAFVQGGQQSFGGGGSKTAYQPKDEHAIAKAVALKAAVDALGYKDGKSGDVVVSTLAVADKFLEWLETPDNSKGDKMDAQAFKDTFGAEPEYVKDANDLPPDF